MQNHHEGCCKHTEHQHEGCCKDEGHHHEGRHNEHHAGYCKGEEHRHEEGCNKDHHHKHGCGHRRSGGRHQRFFGHGELRLVVLDILTRNASHDYELIKAIETLTQGNYTPSPGVIYPTLDSLQDQALIIVSDEEGRRKQIAITAQGQQWLGENREHLEHIHERIKARYVGFELYENPQMGRTLGNFKAVLDLHVSHGNTSDAQVKRVIGIIDRATLDITQLD